MEGIVLIVAADAALRERAFDGLAAAGCRVDGVADLSSATKRLAKDRYDLLVVEEGLAGLETETPVLEVATTVTVATLVELAGQRLTTDPETEPRT